MGNCKKPKSDPYVCMNPILKTIHSILLNVELKTFEGNIA